MKKIFCIIALFLLFLVPARAEKAKWVFPNEDPDVRFFVVTASSDNKNMLVYTMEGNYPSSVSGLYLFDSSAGVKIPLDFSRYADEDYAAQLVEQRLASVRSDQELEILKRLMQAENIQSPYDCILSCGNEFAASLIDLRDDYALIALHNYCTLIINLKNGEAYIAKEARALGANGSYITWDTSAVYHYAPDGTLINTCYPEIPGAASLSLVYMNNDGSLAICAMSIENRMFNFAFVLTDDSGKLIKHYPLNPSKQILSSILSSPDGDMYVIFDKNTIMVSPAYFIDAEKDTVNMLQIKSSIFLKQTIYSAEQTAYDPKAETDVRFIPLRLNDKNELIAISLADDYDLIKINLNRNKVNVLLTGAAFHSLNSKKFPDSIYPTTLFSSSQSHNGSGILSVYPGGAIRHNP